MGSTLSHRGAEVIVQDPEARAPCCASAPAAHLRVRMGRQHPAVMHADRRDYGDSTHGVACCGVARSSQPADQHDCKSAARMPTRELSSVPPASQLAWRVDSNHDQLLGHAQRCSRHASRRNAQPASLAVREPRALNPTPAPLLPSPHPAAYPNTHTSLCD